LTFLKRCLLGWQQNNKDFAQAKRNATFHYGLPMDFFHLVLGDTYGYSEGYWKENTPSLDKSQHNDFDLICKKLQLKRGDKLVEIGPGWGISGNARGRKVRHARNLLWACREPE